jgi:hypothetical protein
MGSPFFAQVATRYGITRDLVGDAWHHDVDPSYRGAARPASVKIAYSTAERAPSVRCG